MLNSSALKRRIAIPRVAGALVLLWSTAALTGCFSMAPSSAGGLGPQSGSAGTGIDAVAAEPLPKLPPPKLEVNSQVRKELDSFLGKKSSFFAESLRRRDDFYPQMREIFEGEGVPHEIMNVALIESGFRTEARSRAGAVGMWQFMKATARRYGLAVSLVHDERKDPVLSTMAAARHLRDLYEAYGDWHLALAAYNAGSGTIDRAIARTGKNDFWKIAKSGRIRRETAAYVPRFIAASIIVNVLGDKAFDADKDDLVELAQKIDANDKFARWSGDGRSSAG